MNLTEAQQAAIDCVDHKLQIVACAGSGKTREVAERILHILDAKDSGAGARRCNPQRGSQGEAG